MTLNLPTRSMFLAIALQFASTAVCLAADAHDAAHDVGLKGDLAFWGFVAFIGFLVALKFLGWDALTSGMQSRESNELQLISEAERLREEAAARLRRHLGQMEALDETVRGVMAEAHRDADQTRRDIRSIADREAELLQARANLEISRTRDQSLHELFDGFSTRIAEGAEQRIKSRLTPQAQQQLVDAAVGEFAAQSR